MRIDLPQCNFKTCIYSFDGNCTNKNRYETCEYQLDKAEIEKCHKEFEELNIIEEQERKEALENAKRNSALFNSAMEYTRAEAIKEFADKLREYKCSYDLDNYHHFEAVDMDTIEDIIKEVLGE